LVSDIPHCKPKEVNSCPDEITDFEFISPQLYYIVFQNLKAAIFVKNRIVIPFEFHTRKNKTLYLKKKSVTVESLMK